MRFALTCAAAALAVSSVAVAAEPAPAASSGQEAKAPKTRKICRRETSTGSAIPKKVCRTVAETKQEAAPAPAVNGGRDGNAAE